MKLAPGMPKISQFPMSTAMWRKAQIIKDCNVSGSQRTSFPPSLMTEGRTGWTTSPNLSKPVASVQELQYCGISISEVFSQSLGASA